MSPVDRSSRSAGGSESATLRAWLVDGCLAALVLLGVSAAIVADVNDDSAGPSMAAYAFAALMAVLVFARRRYPVAMLLVSAAVLLVYYTQDYPAIGLAVPMAIALYSAAERGRLWIAVVVSASLLVISTVFRIAEGDDIAYLLGVELSGTAGLMTAVIALGDSVRSRRGWRAELANQARIAELERERETDRRIEQERLRIARDLHDLLGHTMSIISLHTDVARESLRDDPVAAERSLIAARTATDEVVTELRATLRALRSPEDSPLPGLDRLDNLVETARSAGLVVHVSREGEPVPLPAVADAAAYRVVQEAISNVLRHAFAETVDIALEYHRGQVCIRVRDDGIGSDSEPTTGWGIVGMRERLALLGGRLRTESDHGFTVEAWIPLDETS
ncbi:signal transduction histidine kinase [Stackebrandtia endophytica]|uniref:histidine kinase n=1 Tax=Stackebrandtia endophytica TaxID=1496996 RepID=A0A543AZ06_9ACTN|nr:sensor histidine kinase [Stackebrandtia endophytica]TQL77806.1 signal transduction histidine kinase [Stackebrandtia endophytica]